MKTKIREVNGKKYRFVLTEAFDVCWRCCLHKNGCTSDVDCRGGYFIEEVKKVQPPTKDQIAKVISILDSLGNGCQNLVYDYNITAEIVLEHWNNEEEIKKEK